MEPASAVVRTAEIQRGTLTLEYTSHMHGKVWFVRLVKADGSQVGSAIYVTRQPAEEIFDQQVYFQ